MTSEHTCAWSAVHRWRLAAEKQATGNGKQETHPVAAASNGDSDRMRLNCRLPVAGRLFSQCVGAFAAPAPKSGPPIGSTLLPDALTSTRATAM